MDRRKFLKVSAGLAAAAAGTMAGYKLLRAASTPAPSTPKRPPEGAPNLLFIFPDQWRAQALGCVGDPNVKTPNMDRLASEGVIFTNAYATYPLCSPCRSSIITGRWPHTNGEIQNGILLPDGEVSIAEVLRDQMGYKTGYVGKWHLNDAQYVPPGWRRQGFDLWAGYNSGGTGGGGGYWSYTYYRDSPDPIVVNCARQVPTPSCFQPNHFTNIATEFMNLSRQLCQPFHIFVGWKPPHPPWEDVPEEYAAMYPPDSIELRPNVPPSEEATARADAQKYYGLITNLDDNVGRLMEALEDLGVEDNTIVAFTADHGEMLGSHGYYAKNRPLDESSHIPLIIRYPKKIPAGTRVDSLVSSADVVPTLLSLCGAPIPAGVQGIDLTGLINGGGGGHPQNSIYMEGMMKTTNSWRAVRKDNYMYSVNVNAGNTSQYYLFDMNGDPYQMSNLAGQGRPLETEMRDLLYWWKSELGDNTW